MRTMLRALYDNPFGDRVKAATGVKAPINVRPFARTASVSDLFCWRMDARWETCFELVNLPSLLTPQESVSDEISLVLFGADGKFLNEYRVVLSPFERRRVIISELVGTGRDYGTFACFHSMPLMEILRTNGCYLSERGYTGYKRDNASIWSYVHGNLHAVARENRGQIHNIGVETGKARAYRPQVRFDDIDAFDLIYTNPVGRPLDLTLRFLDSTGREIARNSVTVPRRGAYIAEHKNVSREIVRIESLSRNALWRPVIFKHYDTHFDVFHG